MKVRFLIQAQLELDDAVAWYNQRFEGLGQEFLDELATELFGGLLSFHYHVLKLNREFAVA